MRSAQALSSRSRWNPIHVGEYRHFLAAVREHPSSSTQRCGPAWAAGQHMAPARAPGAAQTAQPRRCVTKAGLQQRGGTRDPAGTAASGRHGACGGRRGPLSPPPISDSFNSRVYSVLPLYGKHGRASTRPPATRASRERWPRGAARGRGPAGPSRARSAGRRLADSAGPGGGAGGDWLPRRLCSAAATAAGDSGSLSAAAEREGRRRSFRLGAAPAPQPPRINAESPVRSCLPLRAASRALCPAWTWKVKWKRWGLALPARLPAARSGSQRLGRHCPVPSVGRGEGEGKEVKLGQRAAPVLWALPPTVWNRVRPPGGRAQVWGPCVCEAYVRYLECLSEHCELTERCCDWGFRLVLPISSWTGFPPGGGR